MFEKIEPNSLVTFIFCMALTLFLFLDIKRQNDLLFEFEFRDNAANLSETLQRKFNEMSYSMEMIHFWLKSEIESENFYNSELIQKEFSFTTKQIVAKTTGLEVMGLAPQNDNWGDSSLEKSFDISGNENTRKAGQNKKGHASNIAISPLKRNDFRPGKDLYDVPAFTELLKRAEVDKRRVTAPLSSIRLNGQNRSLMLAATPLYDDDKASSDDNEPSLAIGFLWAVYDIIKVTEVALAGIDTQGIRLKIFDVTGPEGEASARLISSFPREFGAALNAADGEALNKSEEKIVRMLTFLDRSMVASFYPTDEYIERGMSQEANIILFLGVIVSVMVASYVRLLSDRKRIVEKMVDEKMESLMHANRLTALGEMAAGVAHELNQPLSGIMTYAELSIEQLSYEKPAIKKTQDYLEKIIVQLRRAKKFNSSLKMFSAKRDTTMENIYLNMLVENVLGLLKPAIDSSRAQIKFERYAGLPSVFGNRLRLEQVLINLINNSLHAVPDKENPEIIIALGRTENGAVQLSVSDNGAGFPPTQLDNVFDPFYTTKKAGEGTGLGLAICRQIAEEHDGTLTAENNEQSGARVTLTLNMLFPEKM